jgi:hypothetical protein
MTLFATPPVSAQAMAPMTPQVGRSAIAAATIWPARRIASPLCVFAQYAGEDAPNERARATQADTQEVGTVGGRGRTPRFWYTALQALKNSTPDDDEVWQMVGKPLEVFWLKDI